MPFLGQDWRSPGQNWVKTEEGWKKTTADDKNNNVTMERSVAKIEQGLRNVAGCTGVAQLLSYFYFNWRKMEREDGGILKRIQAAL